MARAFGVDAKTVGKWVKRFESEGLAGLKDRPSRLDKLRRPRPIEMVEQVIAPHRQRFCG